MTIDSISDMATIIRNAIAIKNSLVTLPHTKNNEIIAKILAKEGFIHCVTTTNKTNFGLAPLDSTESLRGTRRASTKKNSVTKINSTRLTPNQENSTQNSQFSKTPLSFELKSTEINQGSALSASFRSNPGGAPKKVIILALKYVGREKKPMIHAIKRISKPSLRWYSQSPIPQSLGGLGIFIVSTSFGIITDKEARDKKLGGEILLEIW